MDNDAEDIFIIAFDATAPSDGRPLTDTLLMVREPTVAKAVCCLVVARHSQPFIDLPLTTRDIDGLIAALQSRKKKLELVP